MKETGERREESGGGRGGRNKIRGIKREKGEEGERRREGLRENERNKNDSDKWWLRG